MTQAFNLSQFANKVNTSGQADLTTAVTGTLPVANGGTGAATLTSGNVLIGAGTSAVTFVAAGTTGNVLTSNGTTWTSAAATGGQLKTEIFSAPGTWTKPASCSEVRLTIVSGGGGGAGSGNPNTPSKSGGPGGIAVVNVPVSAPVSITVGAGGAGGNAGSGGTFGGAGVTGGTSSFGPAVSVTGGAGGGANTPTPATTGIVTVSTGTLIRKFDNVAPTSAPNAILSNYLVGGSSLTQPAQSFSTTGIYGAGSLGNKQGANSIGLGGTGGAIIIEYVG